MNDDELYTDLSSELSYREILGFGQSAEEQDCDLRVVQARDIKKRSFMAIGCNVLFAALATAFFFQSTPVWALAGWSGFNVLFAILSYIRIDRYWRLTGSHAGKADLSLTRHYAIGSGLLWAASFFLLGSFGDEAQLFSLWAITLCVMVLMTVLLPTLPAATLSIVVPVSIAAAAALIFGQQYYLATIPAAVGGLLTTLSLRSARAEILYAFADGIVNEKSETVSLLLKEFEDSGADWLWQTDSQRCAVHVGPRFAYAMDAQANEIEGKPLLQLIAGDSWDHGEYQDALHELAEKLKKREAFSNLIVPVTIKGKQRFWELSASPRHSESGSFLGFRGVGSDVTEQRESEEKISHLARFDTLTGLPNRLQLNEALSKALSDADKWRRKCGLMMIDLDRFKAVNDTLGHLVGDRLLAQVAQRLHALMTENELCGRLGGDEFAIVINDASDSEYVRSMARRIIDTLSRPYLVDQNTLYIGASVGSAIGPRDGRTVELLMRSADLALYRSKDDGGNSHNNYERKLHSNAEERRQMEFELRNALDKEQFHLEYQPLVSSSSDHTLLGFETLLRWQNPKFGNVSPAKFVPVAEEANLIVPIGDWVLRQACKHAMQWPETTRVAVNISVDQLTSPGFADAVISALDDAQMPAWRLELEVTESIFIRDAKLATGVLERLRQLGCKLSLDDFGTGYSSLGYLKDVRFDTIKIDRSFVQGASQNKRESLAIIRAVVAMAESMEMSTTAEGVETEGELAMIQQLGCQKIQGYYFGRPMPYKDACELFKQVPVNKQVA